MSNAQIKVTSDTSQALKSFDQLGKKMKDTRGIGAQTFSSIGRSAMALAGIGSVGAGIAIVAKQSLMLAASQEQLAVSFETMLGSGTKAKELLSNIETLGSRTPYQYEDLANAGKSLLAFGIGAEQIVPTLTRIGDVASGLNIPIGELAEIYGKARVQGRLFAEDINQLTGRGIPIIAQLARQFEVTESQVKKLVESGDVGFANLERAIADMTSEGGQFFGMMDKQSKTLIGTISTLKDEFASLGREIGSGLVEPTKEAVKFLSALIAETKDFGVFGTAEGIGRRMAGEGALPKSTGRANEPIIPDTRPPEQIAAQATMDKMQAAIEKILKADAMVGGSGFPGEYMFWDMLPAFFDRAREESRKRFDPLMNEIFGKAQEKRLKDAREFEQSRLRDLGGRSFAAGTQLQKLGLGKTPELIQQVDLARRSERHLSVIADSIKKLNLGLN